MAVDNSLHIGLHNIMGYYNSEINEKYVEGSFHPLTPREYFRKTLTATFVSNSHTLGSVSKNGFYNAKIY